MTIREVEISPQRQKQLQDNLLLLFTGFTRYSNEISLESKHNVVRNTQILHRMKEMVAEGERLLCAGSLDDFGCLLGESWKLKQLLSQKISTSQVDEIYRTALKNGALGGKILGAGGGGFLLLYAPKKQHAQIKGALAEYQFVDFSLEKQGSMLIH